MAGVYLVEQRGGAWKIVRDGKELDEPYRTENEAKAALQELLGGKTWAGKRTPEVVTGSYEELPSPAGQAIEAPESDA